MTSIVAPSSSTGTPISPISTGSPRPNQLIASRRSALELRKKLQDLPRLTIPQDATMDFPTFFLALFELVGTVNWAFRDCSLWLYRFHYSIR